jgi:hypothetical protein
MKIANLYRNILLTLMAFSVPAQSGFGAETKSRSCIIMEQQKGGMYVYLRCDESGKDIWLATVAREFKPNEKIDFVDAPPITDFYSKFLNRVFPEVIFTDLLPPDKKQK